MKHYYAFKKKTVFGHHSILRGLIMTSLVVEVQTISKNQYILANW